MCISKGVVQTLLALPTEDLVEAYTNYQVALELAREDVRRDPKSRAQIGVEIYTQLIDLAAAELAERNSTEF
jgi:hypothetical protein